MPTFRGVTTINVVAGPTSIDPGKPVGTVATDILIAIIQADGSTDLHATVTAPVGWTLVQRDAEANLVSLQQQEAGAYWAFGSVASTSFTLTQTTDATGSILAYSGVDTTVSPIDTSSVNGDPATLPNSSPETALGVTTTHENALVIAAWCPDGPVSLGSTPSGWTQRVDNTSDPNQRIAEKTFAPAAFATGDQAVTDSGPVLWSAFQVALNAINVAQDWANWSDSPEPLPGLFIQAPPWTGL